MKRAGTATYRPAQSTGLPDGSQVRGSFPPRKQPSRSYRVAVVSDTLPPAGNSGIGNSHHHLILALRARGCRVRAFTFQDAGSRPGEADLVRRGAPSWFVMATKKVVRAVLQGYEEAFKGRGTGALALEFNVSLLGALNGLRLILPVWRFRPDFIVVPDKGAVACLWPGFLKKRAVVIAHSNPLRFLDQPLIGLRSEADARLAFSLERRMIRGSAAVVCPSRYMRGFFGRTMPSYQGAVPVIPNLMDAREMDRIPGNPFPGTGASREAVPFVYVPAAANINKGRQFVFELLRRLAGAYRKRIGFFLSGALDPEMQVYLKHLPANALVFAPGNVPFEENIAHLKACHFCLSPTLIENFGMALLEAQYCGLPVVTFDVGGNRELVSEGRSGYLAPYLDVETLLARALKLAREPALRRRMGRWAARRTARRFSTEAVSDRFLGLFRSLEKGTAARDGARRPA